MPYNKTLILPNLCNKLYMLETNMKDSSNSSFLFSLTATLDFEIKQYDLILQMLHANINILFTTNLPNLNPILDQQATCQQGWILFTSSRLSSLATCIWPSPYKKSFQHGLISLCQSLSLYIYNSELLRIPLKPPCPLSMLLPVRNLIPLVTLSLLSGSLQTPAIPVSTFNAAITILHL